MKIKTVLRKMKSKIEDIKRTRAWQKMFVYKIDEEKMREYQNQHRLMNLTTRNF